MLYKKILIAADSSPYSIPPVAHGCELARLMDAEVMILQIIDERLAAAQTDSDLGVMEAFDLLKEEAAENVKALSEKYGAKCRISTVVAEGIPTNTILEKVKGWQADLVILGTHGHTGIIRLLTGSVADYIRRHAKIPVLIVPSK